MAKIKTMKIKQSELWNLDITLAEYILPRLIAFRKMKRTGVPMNFKSIKEWNKELDKMIYAFNKIVNLDNIEEDYLRYEKPKVKEGLKSFSDNFGALWD